MDPKKEKGDRTTQNKGQKRREWLHHIMYETENAVAAATATLQSVTPPVAFSLVLSLGVLCGQFLQVF